MEPAEGEKGEEEEEDERVVGYFRYFEKKKEGQVVGKVTFSLDILI